MISEEMISLYYEIVDVIDELMFCVAHVGRINELIELRDRLEEYAGLALNVKNTLSLTEIKIVRGIYYTL